MKPLRFGVLAGAFGVVLAGAAAACTNIDARAEVHRDLPYYSDSTLTPAWMSETDARDHAHAVGEFHLVDQSGRPVTRRDLDGHLTLVAFFYTNCHSLCPTVRGQLARVRDAFAGDTLVRIISHTVQPEADQVAALAHYARVNGIDGQQWRLVTGERGELERLARTQYFVELTDTSGFTSGSMDHTETLVLLDAERRIRGVYSGSIAFEVTQLIADMRKLRAGF